MSKLNNQSIDLFAIPCVQNLTNENAAAVSGGALEPTDVTLYSEPDALGYEFGSNKKIENLSDFGFNDATGSIFVSNAQTWRFYENANFEGAFIDVGPGEFFNAGDFGMTISSFQAI
jgi:hypothetical protein